MYCSTYFLSFTASSVASPCVSYRALCSLPCLSTYCSHRPVTLLSTSVPSRAANVPMPARVPLSVSHVTVQSMRDMSLLPFFLCCTEPSQHHRQAPYSSISSWPRCSSLSHAIDRRPATVREHHLSSLFPALDQHHAAFCPQRSRPPTAHCSMALPL